MVCMDWENTNCLREWFFFLFAVLCCRQIFIFLSILMHLAQIFFWIFQLQGIFIQIQSFFCIKRQIKSGSNAPLLLFWHLRHMLPLLPSHPHSVSTMNDPQILMNLKHVLKILLFLSQGFLSMPLIFSVVRCFILLLLNI